MPFLAVGALIALASGRALNALSLGDDVARGLGQDVRRSRLVRRVRGRAAVRRRDRRGSPIAFVGLTVAHVARAITGPDNRWVLPFSGVLGAALVVCRTCSGASSRSGQLRSAS